MFTSELFRTFASIYDRYNVYKRCVFGKNVNKLYKFQLFLFLFTDEYL